MDDATLPVDLDLHLLNISHDWLLADHKRVDSLVMWHEQELLLTGVAILGIIVVQSLLSVEVWRLRREVRRE